MQDASLSTAAANDIGRTMLVCTVKDEGPNILEWVAYHRLIGFDDIVVYQNDSFDTTDRTLKLLHRLRVIQYFPNPLHNPELRTYQNRAYRRASALPCYKQAAWCMALDGDEFLKINVGDGRVADLIRAIPDADEIRLNWRVFGSSGLRELDSRLVTERFHQANIADLAIKYPMPVKTLFRANRFRIPGIHLPKGSEGPIVSRNGSGRSLDEILVRGFQVTDPEPYKLAQVNHYMVKDSESFLMKSARGSSSHPDRAISLNYWKKRNINRAEDRGLCDWAPRILAEMQALDEQSGGHLLRLRQRALRLWRHRIAEIKQDEAMRALYDQLV